MRAIASRGRVLVFAGLVLMGLAGLSAPASGQSMEPRRSFSDFAVSGAVPDRLPVTFGVLAGRSVQWEDEYSVGIVTLGADGTFVYRDDLGNNGVRGFWWVDPKGNLCITSKAYWWSGQCFSLHGSSLSDMRGMVPQIGPQAFYPAAMLR